MSANQSPLPSPEATLNKLKLDLDTKKKAANDTAQDIAELNESITGFEPITKEIKQVISAYNQALKNLRCDRDDLQGYLSEKGNKIKSEITNDVKKQIEEKIKEFDDWIYNTEKELLKNHDDTQTQYLNAKSTYEEKQQIYDNLKNFQKDVDNRIRETKSIRERSEKEYNQKNIGNAFFLVNEIEENLGKIHIKTTDEFERELNDASLHLYEAKEDLRKKTKMWETVDKEFKEKQRELELLKKNRREEILKKISNISAGSAPVGEYRP